VRTWDLRRIVLPITYFIEKPFQNWSRVSTDLLGTVILYLDYQAPLAELRKELKRLVAASRSGSTPNWDGKVCALQVTDTTQSTIVVRALVSSTNPGKLGDLRCEVREGLIDFLRREHPESLPKMRNVDVTPDEEISRKNASPARTGKEHERGDKSPGVHPEAKSDGAETRH
jgi:small-conductance mechanosensitive channel